MAKQKSKQQVRRKVRSFAEKSLVAKFKLALAQTLRNNRELFWNSVMCVFDNETASLWQEH